MQIIRPSQIVECVVHHRAFARVRDPGSGFRFECDAEGVIADAAQAAHAVLLATDPEYRDIGVTECTWTDREPAVGRCVCGGEVDLDRFTCECDCGRLYNSSGQELSDPSGWGEETGEHPSECW